jgi:Ca2+-binding EF-hand superfamily protein
MGCCESSREIPENYEDNKEDAYSNAISSLQLQNITSRFIDNTLHRHSSRCFLTKAQLDLAFQKLNIKFSSFFNAFRVQTENKSSEIYYKLKLCALGILLGSGTNDEKLTLLFRNYDRSTETSLMEIELRHLLADVLEIELILLPGLAVSMNTTQVTVQNESKAMKIMKEKVAESYFDLLMGKAKKIELEEFLQKLSGKEGKRLINARKMQNYALKLARREENIEESKKIRKAVRPVTVIIQNSNKRSSISNEMLDLQRYNSQAYKC